MALGDPSFTNAKQYGPEDVRAAFDKQEGVDGAADLKVTGGAVGLSVDVAAGVGFVQGDSVADQALYRVRNDAAVNSAAFPLGAIPAANGANPRLDQIVLRVYDDDADASGTYTARLEVIAGVPTVGATLDNRLGAAALPASAMRLADVLVPAAFAGPLVTATHIRDRRPWARGAYSRTVQLAGADYAVSGTSFAALDATNLQKRIECSGKPLRVEFRAVATQDATGGRQLEVQPRIDGATALGTAGMLEQRAASHNGIVEVEWELAPTAGSHLIAVYAKVNAGTVTLQRGADYEVQMVIQEILRESASND